MALNESKGNMYSWITHTWNTVKGECPHGCTYCYMKRWGKQKPVHFDEKELKTDLGSGNFIFVGSSCDLFAEAIPDEWILKTLAHCSKFDNAYLFQSKNTKLFNIGEVFPEKTSLCTTIETNRYYPDIMKNSPLPIERARGMTYVDLPRYVTIEPIMDFDFTEMIILLQACNPIQVNIGFNTSYKVPLPEPSEQKTIELIIELKKFTKVKLKCNSQRVIKDKSLYL